MTVHSVVLALGFALNLLTPPVFASFTRSRKGRHVRWALYAAEWLVVDALFHHWLLASGAAASLVIAIARLAVPLSHASP